MHDAGAVVGGGVVGQVHRAQALVACVRVGQRVGKVHATQLLTQAGGHYLAGDAVARQALVHQRGGQQQQAITGVHQRIFERRVEVQRLVGREGPGRGGPDHHEGGFGQGRQTKGRGQLGGFGAGEGHVNRLALLVGIFDFKLGQRRAAIETPVHGFQAAVDKTPLHHALERADFTALVGKIHRAVRVLPIAQHAQALEIGHLDADLLGGIGAALGLHLVAAQRPAKLLFDRVFNRQPVAIPTGHVLGIKAGQLAGLDDHVLEHLVDGVAHVDGAVGVGRAVVQDELGRSAARGAQLLVHAFVLPLLHPTRLALGQVAAHRKRGVGQVEGAAVVGCGRAVGGRARGLGRVHGGWRQGWRWRVSVSRAAAAPVDGRGKPGQGPVRRAKPRHRAETGGADAGQRAAAWAALRAAVEFGRAWSGDAWRHAQCRSS